MPIKCNLHPWMKMYLSVIGNPHFAVTGKGRHIQPEWPAPGNLYRCRGA
jgi:hypothetical protein